MKLPLRMAVLLLASTSASADAGLDVAVLVDRSRSMSQHTTIAPALLRMTFELLARNAETYRVEHRLAVISFASSASIAMPFTRARADERMRVVHAVDALPGERGETDVLAAFAAAERLFESLPRDPARRRAVVLLTDGVPYVRGGDMERYARTLTAYVATHLPPSGSSIDVVLLSSAGASRHDALWRSLAGTVHHAGTAPSDILANVHAVVTCLAGTASGDSESVRGTSGFEEIVVPPYLDMIVFDAFRGSPEAPVEVFPPGSSRPLEGGVDGVESVPVGDVLLTLAVARPQPGRWRVRKSQAASRVRVRSQHFFPRGVLLQPDPAVATPPRKHVRVAYQVLESERPLEELPDYPLTLGVTLAVPDGTRVALPLERDAALGRTAFRTIGQARCTVAGRYWTDVRVTTVDASGRPLEIFRDRWSGFTVAPPAEPVQAAAFAPHGRATTPRAGGWAIAAAVAALLAAVAFRKT